MALQQTFEQMITQLNQYLIDIPTQLAKLSKIQDTIIQISTSYLGDIKNLLKDFQSLLTVRIRKLKRKQKKIQLNQFDKIFNQKQFMKKKAQVIYIDEDKDQKKHIKRKQNRIKNNKITQVQSKKSYGTMNSAGSNENQSNGSERKSGGSQSRSGENNALAVLLNNKQNGKRTNNNNGNINHDDQKKTDKNIDKNKNNINSNINNLNTSTNYDFSLVMSTSVTVRQRDSHKIVKFQHKNHNNTNQVIQMSKSKVSKKQDSNQDQKKDDAFIFHRPKKQKKIHF